MIPGLDGLRAIAFLGVLGFHTFSFPFGWTGVNLFFVLSGFLITGILLRMKASLVPRDYFSKFYGRRFLRIFPLYYFYLVLLVALVAGADLLRYRPLERELGEKLGGQIGYALFYIYNLYHASSKYQITLFLNPLWSLSNEEQFYILWPLFILFTPQKYLKRLFLSAMVLAPILRLTIGLVYQAHPFSFLGNDPQLAVYVLPFSHVDAFAMGAYVSQFELPRPRLQIALAVILVPALGYLSQALAGSSILWETLGYEFPMRSLYKFVWGYSVLDYLFALAIYCVAKTGLLTRLFDFPVLRYLGKISYGLYIYHGGVVWLLQRANLPYGFDVVGSVKFYLMALLITTVIASLSFFLLEQPIIRLKDKFFDTRSSNRVPARLQEPTLSP